MYQLYTDKYNQVDGWKSQRVTETRSKSRTLPKVTAVMLTRARDRPQHLISGSKVGVASPASYLAGEADEQKKNSFPTSEDAQGAAVITPFGSPDSDRQTAKRGTSAVGTVTGHAEGDGGDPQTSATGVGLEPNSRYTPKVLGDLPSVKLMTGRQQPRITLGFDTEFYDSGLKERKILSYQYAFIHPDDETKIHEIVFVPEHGNRLTLGFMLTHIVKAFELWEVDKISRGKFTASGVPARLGRYWEAHTDPKEPRVVKRFYSRTDAMNASAYPLEKSALKYAYTEQNRVRRDIKADSQNYNPLKGEGVGYHFDEKRLGYHGLRLLLLCHYAPADLGTFFEPDPEDFLMRKLISAGGGMFSQKPIDVIHKERNGGGRSTAYYPYRLDVRDTMTYAVAGQSSLATLGEAINFPKVELPYSYSKSNMLELAEKDPALFLDYGANDACVCLEYSASMWGTNTTTPATLPTAAAKAVEGLIISFMGITKGSNMADEARTATERFREIFAGVTSVDSELNAEHDVENGMSFYRERELKPINGSARAFIDQCAQAFRGGYNAFFTSGYITKETYDHDVQGAYPTAMALVQDVDFEHSEGVVRRVVKGWEELTLDDFPDYNTPFVGYVRFEFPEGLRYPCIPVSVLGSVIYPLRLPDNVGVYATAPEIRLALKLGARVWCQMGSFAYVLRPDGVNPSHMLREAIKGLIEDRNTAKKVFGPKSLEQSVVKLAVNSLYGKLAQDVSTHTSWNAVLQQYGDVGGSAVTSPYHATMTTSLVRALLLAAINELTELGYEVYSVTTDGFITNAPDDVVKGLDLYGLADLFAEARQALSGDPEVWEVKHTQKTLLNTMTRQNVSLDEGGVLAHGGYKVPRDISKDSYEDRLHMVRILTNREGAVNNTYMRFPSFKEQTLVGKRKDFYVTEAERSMKFIDVKRKPVVSTISTDTVVMPDDGEERQIVHYETEPWDTPQDFIRAKTVTESISHLGTADAVKDFLHRCKHSSRDSRMSEGRKWEIMKSILQGHRMGLDGYHIPTLSAPKLALSKKLEWLDSWGMRDKPITKSNWDNMRKPERQTHMLPFEEVKPYLEVMQNQPIGLKGYPLDF